MSETNTESKHVSYLQIPRKWKFYPLEWLMSVDHKRIGIMYIVTMMMFFLVAMSLGFTIKLQRLFPASQGWEIIPASLYGQVFTLHAVIMVFLFILPGVPATLGNFILPLQLGAKDVAFPRINLYSYWFYLFGATMAVIGVVLGGTDTGWTFTPPYSAQAKSLTLWGTEFNTVSWMLTAVFILGWGTILTGINFIVTIHRLRAPGMTFFRMPLFTWSLYATSWIQVLATPVVGITALMLAIERYMPVGFFDPAKGGDPILFQHLFWIYSHPAVYIMILPAMGVISEIIPTFCQKTIFGYKGIALATCSIAGVGYLVWAHHMFTTGMSDFAQMAFSFLTFMVGIPTAIKVFNWVATLWGGSISLRTPMLFALAFVFNFSIGGLTGLFLGCLATDIHLHDTDFVVAHFHYTMLGGAAFALFGGVHYWCPKIIAKMYNEKVANVAFWLMFVGFNVLYMPMFVLGLNGMPRRYHTYLDIPILSSMQFISTIGSWILVLGILIMIANWVYTVFWGKPCTEKNPWNSSTLEWQTNSPPTEFNYEKLGIPTVTRDPYDYEAFEEAKLRGEAQ